MATAVIVRVLNDLPIPAPVSGVEVAIYTTLGAFVTSGPTDVLGEANFLLPDALYHVLFYKPGLSILPKQPQIIDVDSMAVSNTFEATGHERVLPESLDPFKCRISGHIYGVTGKPVKNARIILRVTPEPLLVDQNIIFPQHTATVKADDNGYFEFDVYRNVEYELFFVWIGYMNGTEAARIRSCTPDVPSMKLLDFLYPLVIDVGLSVPTLSIPLASGVDDTTLVTMTFSDGVPRSVVTKWADVVVGIDDETIAKVSFMDGKLFITPLAVGTANITFTRKILSGMLILPDPPFTSDTLALTVT